MPGEISLAGFDDSVIGKYYTPSLTTIHVPMDEMIRDAVEILLHPDAKTCFPIREPREPGFSCPTR